MDNSFCFLNINFHTYSHSFHHYFLERNNNKPFELYTLEGRQTLIGKSFEKDC